MGFFFMFHYVLFNVPLLLAVISSFFCGKIALWPISYAVKMFVAKMLVAKMSTVKALDMKQPALGSILSIEFQSL